MHPIHLDGAYNARAAGSSTSPWVVRSAAPDLLTEQGRATLRALDVKLIIDLRESVERPLEAGDPGVPIRSVPAYGTPTGPPATGTLEDVYASLLGTRGGALAEAVGALADALGEHDGAVLVHCTAGKDRTGLVVALALLAVGTPAEDVVDDYAASGESVTVNRVEIVEAVLDGLALDADAREQALRLHLDSPADVMRGAIARIDSAGGAAAYLLDHGLRQDQLQRLRTRALSREPAATGIDA